MTPALLTEDLSAEQKYGLSRREIQALAPRTSFPRDLTDAALSDFPRVVLVRDTPRPSAPAGAVIRQLPSVEGVDGHWHQAWDVMLPGAARVAELKAQLEADVWEIVERRLRDALPPGRGTLTTVIELDIRGASHPSRIEAQRLQPLATAIIQRIRAAATLEEALAIRDEIEGA